MATLRKRGKRWEAQIRKAGAQPQYATFDTKAAAEFWARRIEREIDDGRARGGRAATGTVAELIERYEREVEPYRPIGRTKQSALNVLKREIGIISVRDLDATTVIRFARYRASQGSGPGTVSIYLTYLGTVLRTARALWRLALTDEPVREARHALGLIGVVGRARERSRRPTQTELDALCSHWRSNPRQIIPLADIVEFAVGTAMRLGEICRIEWVDLNRPNQTIVIRDRKDPRGKTGNDEIVPLLTVTGYDPLEIIDRQPGGNDRIFPYKANSVSTLFTRACAKLGIEDLHAHDLRHEGASRLFEAGLKVEQVALITGHRDWRTLKRYTQLKPEDITAEFSSHDPSTTG